MQSLYAPWRYAYLVGEKPTGGCFFCDAVAGPEDESSLLVYRGRESFVILNRYPYANGHVMVVPNGHVGMLSSAPHSTRSEIIDLAAAAETALRELYRADGVNLGMNLGKAAGAGVESHFHLHVVPRWEGDTNFMAVTAGTRIIAEELSNSRGRLRTALLARLGPEPGRAGSP